MQWRRPLIRTRIQLIEEPAARLKETVHSGNESMAAIIRTALDQFLTRLKPDQRDLGRQALVVGRKY
jgi:hypothetical protein